MTFTVSTREGARALPPGTVVRSAAGSIAGRFDSWHGAALGDERSFPWDRLALPLEVLWPHECPTCSGPRRETVNMVCQTCGTDYAAPPTPEQTAPAELDELRQALAAGEASDGFHTHAELYAYRRVYNAALFNEWACRDVVPVVKSWKHSDGELAFGGGWFVVVATLPTGQVSNHYRAEHWDLFQIPEVDLAPKYDGHTPAEALGRLQEFVGPGTYARGGMLPANAEPIPTGDLGGYLVPTAAAAYGQRLLADLNRAVLNPDCRDGKHKACSGDGWDTQADEPALCPCSCTPRPPGRPTVAEAKTKTHDGAVRVWCAPCHDYVPVQGAVDAQNAVHVTPRHLEPHRASQTHLAALAAATRPRRRRGRRGGRSRGGAT